MDRNPSPPREFYENERAKADLIEGTIVEKHWILRTLISAVKEVDKADNNGEISELDENIESEMCQLWDISMESGVANFLMECDVTTTLLGIIIKSKAPRLTEISVGILANLMCNAQHCQLITESEEFIDVILALLGNVDAGILIETVRLISTCISTRPTCDIWMKFIKQDDSIQGKISFFLKSSTNNILIHALAQLLDNLLDADEALLSAWGKEDLVSGVTEAIKQLGNSNEECTDILFHILQLISTSSQGCLAINQHGNEIFKLMGKYLKKICEEDFVEVNGRQCGIASVVDVIGKMQMPNRLNKRLCSSIMQYVLQLISFTADDTLHQSEINVILKDTLLTFWSQLLQFSNEVEFALDELEKAPEKNVMALVNAMKRKCEQDDDFECIKHLKQLCCDSGRHNMLTQLLNNM